MKKTTPFEWNDQADETFRDLKHMLSTAPVLAAPVDKESLMLYIAATSRSVSMVLVVERLEKGKIQSVQHPVYYPSEVFSASKQNYPHYQKMCYSVYFSAKKLKQYFQEHVVTVVSTAPIEEIMGCQDASGQVAKWAIELAGNTILYEPRSTIKSQALADFLAAALQDAESLVLKCEGCQRFSKRSHQPASAPRTIPITWPFAVWGLDMVGSFKTRGGMTHLLVAVDKFTKWIEARPSKKLDGPTVVRFIKDIVVRYGVPPSIITDNGTNFAKGALGQYCSVSGIHLDLASVPHPQSNGQVKRANGLILSGIKPRLVEPLVRSPDSWLDELSGVL
ncbi:uncharacterized protein [Aegilops tauschii subsp. strangulata]|uniref:uncharacterized protein n=1 Tax=Aegilops tauschii subsp. strangulata TaxID=200361 RepID=UPI003CC86224